jgi:hypothetical protein
VKRLPYVTYGGQEKNQEQFQLSGRQLALQSNCSRESTGGTADMFQLPKYDPQKTWDQNWRNCATMAQAKALSLEPITEVFYERERDLLERMVANHRRHALVAHTRGGDKVLLLAHDYEESRKVRARLKELAETY